MFGLSATLAVLAALFSGSRIEATPTLFTPVAPVADTNIDPPIESKLQLRCTKNAHHTFKKGKKKIGSKYRKRMKQCLSNPGKTRKDCVKKKRRFTRKARRDNRISLSKNLKDCKQLDMDNNYENILSVVDTEAIGKTTSPAQLFFEINNQWSQNKKELAKTEAPYLVCVNELPPHKTSGYVRGLNLEKKCPGMKADNIISNSSDKTCWVNYLSYAVGIACRTKHSRITVTPYIPLMKIPHFSLTKSISERSMQESYKEKHRFLGSFCEKEPSSTELIDAKAIVFNQLVRVWSALDMCSKRVGGVDFDNHFSIFVEDPYGIVLEQTSQTDLEDCIMDLVIDMAKHLFFCSIELYPEIELLNDTSGWIIQGSFADDGLPLHAAGIEGQGQVAQISDDGLDLSSCYFFSNNGEVAQDRSMNVDTSLRKVIQYFNRRSISLGDDQHGTHCAGTIAGKICPYKEGCKSSSQQDGIEPTGCKSSSQQDGIAPEAKLAIYDIGNENLSPGSVSIMFAIGIRAKAYIHSASWGSPDNSYYSSRSKDFDKFQYENQKYLAVMAAGNKGSGNKIETLWNAGKNSIIVCASNNKNTGLGENYIASFSSIGPTHDGRMKPEICAPGKNIISAYSSWANGRPRQCHSRSDSGTSMACPGIAGAALLVRQYFMDGFYPSGTKRKEDGFTPKGSLIKAIILNSGKAMLGRDNGNSNVGRSVPYDSNQGFGLVSLIDGVYLKNLSKAKLHIENGIYLTEKKRRYVKSYLINKCDAEIFSATLSYHDKENTSFFCTKCIVNCLELTISTNFGSKTTYYPNGLSEPDEKNNSQRIRLDAAPGDILTLTVNAANLATESQSFSLAVTGCFEPSSQPTMIPSSELSTMPTTRVPVFPDDFMWSSNGVPNGYDCIQILESAEPAAYTWYDNYFCWKHGMSDPGMKWSSACPISNMRCTQIQEIADPYTWNDNYLCVPHSSPLNLSWSSAGPIDNKTCIQWIESAAPDIFTWNDNYLCSDFRLNL